MLSEDYVSFETAKLLKEKGFDEQTERFYNEDGRQLCGASSYNWNEDDGDFSRPTLWMAMKWLREVHSIHISVEMGFDVDNPQYFFFVPSICKFSHKDGEYITPFDEKEFNTYEEACEEAIKYCLKELI